MDIADIASELEERLRSQALFALKVANEQGRSFARTPTEVTGTAQVCANCEEVLPSTTVARFCDADCIADWDKRHRARRIAGRHFD